MNKFSLLTIAMMLLVLSACSPNPNEAFIQGTWSIVNETDAGGSTSAIKYFEWEFREGYFYRQQELDPRSIIQSQGRYRILESDEDGIVLELFDIKGERFTYNNSPTDIKIEIHRDQDTIRVVNMLFERAAP
jgi:hypothetical protein